MARNVSVQHLRGVFANIPILNAGEFYFATDTNKLYVGTGSVNVLIGPSGGSIGGQGVTTINFGVFPGGTDATTIITGQTGILAGSIVSAWIIPTATADHSVDEHWADPPDIVAGNIIAGTGFTIYGKIKLQQDLTVTALNNNSPRIYGLYTVGWLWN